LHRCGNLGVQYIGSYYAIDVLSVVVVNVWKW
jgi:hypothetical protein